MRSLTNNSNAQNFHPSQSRFEMENGFHIGRIGKTTNLDAQLDKYNNFYLFIFIREPASNFKQSVKIVYKSNHISLVNFFCHMDVQCY